MFISQAINQDGSCQNVVNKLALNRDAKTSISTSGYCKARNRLSTSTIKNLTKELLKRMKNKLIKTGSLKIEISI
jgi:hypothetical protein